MPTETLSWRERNAWIADLLEQRTGQNVNAWNARIRSVDVSSEAQLRRWLTEQGVTGYPQMLLVMERFGYPDFLLASADELIDAQYADRAELRPILDAVLARATAVGQVTLQARKGYISLRTPRRTFASIQPTTRRRVDVGLRLDAPELRGRLEPATSVGQSAMTARVGLTSAGQVDEEVEAWLRHAYAENV
jgi:hypothetical protein